MMDEDSHHALAPQASEQFMDLDHDPGGVAGDAGDDAGDDLYGVPDEELESEFEGAPSEVSDADSEYLRVQDQISRADADRQTFLRDTFDKGGDLFTELTRKAQKRGARKARELPTEIKVLVDEANEAFYQSRYDEALRAAKETIRINAEVPSAWGILAMIYEERQDWRHALEAKRIQASLARKDAQLWLATADLALRMPDGDRSENLHIAMECYTKLLDVDRQNLQARLGKADVLADLGHSSKAVAGYLTYLKAKPFNLRAVRNLAENAFSARRTEDAIKSAIKAYSKCITHSRAGRPLEDQGEFDWIDIRIFIELFAFLKQYKKASQWLSYLARWMLGRSNESLWDKCADDREWDLDDIRRREYPGFVPDQHHPTAYGSGLPLDLRGKLAIYCFQMEMEAEAMHHILWLDPENLPTREALRSTPTIAKEVADQLFESGKLELSMTYYDLYRDIEDGPLDADYFVRRARCHLKLEDLPAAEECLISALDADEDNIEARYELATMYEAAQERDAAFRLVGEALSLEKGHREQDFATHRFVMDSRGRIVQKPRKYRRNLTRPVTHGKYRPRRLGGDSTRKRFEEEVASRLREKYAVCQQLKAEMAASGDDTDSSAVFEWRTAAKELVDDFRSFREFYSWDKYVSSLGYGNFFDPEKGTGAAGGDGGGGGGDGHVEGETERIAKLAKRLHSTLAPAEAENAGAEPKLNRQEHRGIPFDDWLDLFLEYAISLARDRQIGEAYKVCQSARDSIVYNKAKDSMFLIHLAWASCAVHAGDEETCVSIARYFISQNTFATGSYMMFAALCRACQTASTWYTAGPPQKFMLRQIRQMDDILAARARGEGKPAPAAGTVARPTDAAAENAHEGVAGLVPRGVDVCLLVVYGSILFSSSSYQYSLAYFLRAASLDPLNPTINMFIALAYIHWSLRRQSQNRQYLIMQGLSYLSRYYDDRVASTAPEERQEGHFNVARCYHQLGIHDLAMEHYRRVLLETPAVAAVGEPRPNGREDLVLEAAMNMRIYCLTTGDVEGARAITEEWLVL